MNASCSVPVGSAAAVICDTGALIDYLVASAPDHRLFRAPNTGVISELCALQNAFR